MKIKSVEARWVHIPIPPERQHTSDFGKTLSFDGTLVRIDTECGLTGWGEAKAQVGGMAQNQALTCMINEEFGPLLKGEDPRDITRLWDLLYSGTRGHYALREGRVFPVLGRRGIYYSFGDQRRRLRVVGHSRQVTGCEPVWRLQGGRRSTRIAGLCVGRLGRARTRSATSCWAMSSAAGLARSRCGSASTTAIRARRRAACTPPARRWARRSA